MAGADALAGVTVIVTAALLDVDAAGVGRAPPSPLDIEAAGEGVVLVESAEIEADGARAGFAEVIAPRLAVPFGDPGNPIDPTPSGVGTVAGDPEGPASARSLAIHGIARATSDATIARDRDRAAERTIARRGVADVEDGPDPSAGPAWIGCMDRLRGIAHQRRSRRIEGPTWGARSLADECANSDTGSRALSCGNV
jgi:hypothetical protein